MIIPREKAKILIKAKKISEYQQKHVELKWERVGIECRMKIQNYYGFTANPSFSTHHNACIHMGNLPPFDYWNRPSNMAFHDLTSSITPPPNLRSLLGLGLGFIPTQYNTTRFSKVVEDPTGGFLNLERSLRLRCFFMNCGDPLPDSEWNLKLHVKSDWEPPNFLPKPITHRLHQFWFQLKFLFLKMFIFKSRSY